MTLYIVATPIGNLEDITLRALRILREVPLIAAEDTRSARVLLKRYEITTKVTSYHDASHQGRTANLVEHLKTQDLALISEAGTPTINDPGYELVVAAVEAGIQVVPVPGPSAVIAALSVSGLPPDQFVYLGFPPRKQGERRTWINGVLQERRTLVLYESPHRLRETLNDLLEILGNRRCAIARELTKLFEETWRGSLSEAFEHFDHPRGEFVVVVAGAGESALNANDVEALIAEGVRNGERASEMAARLAPVTGLNRRELYRRILDAAGSTGPMVPDG